MKNIQRYVKRNWITVLVFVIAIIITAASTFYAAETIFASSEVSYDNTNSTLTSTNVQDALDELYAKAMQAGGDCPTGYEKRNENQYSFLCVMPSAPKSCSEFTNDSWETIISNIQSYQTYEVGCTKEVTLGNSLGTHTLRVANNTTPDECSTTGFSQTACGFVLEFADIITTYYMRSVNTNAGGWPSSNMMTYLNSTSDTTSIYNSIPTVIKDAIIDTTVVSGHSARSGETNFTSTDKLYLLSIVEVYGNNDSSDSVTLTETRQLDYYAGISVTSSSYAGAIKQLNGSNGQWWLRSASSTTTSYFRFVHSTGISSATSASSTLGVAPAFRIA